MTQLHLEVVTPDRSVISTEATYVGVPGVEGQFGIMPGHVPLLSAVAVGCLYYRHGGVEDYVFVSGGFAEVSNDRVSILAEAAELGCNIDVERAVRARQRAEIRFRDKPGGLDETRAYAALQRALARLSIATRQ